MKANIDVRPGDLFMWHYAYDNTPVVERERFFSTLRETWAPIYGLSLMVSVTTCGYAWLSEHGYFEAQFDDLRDSIRVNNVLCGYRDGVFPSRLNEG